MVNSVGSELPRRLTQISRALTYATSLDETLRLTVECAADLVAAGPVLLMLKNNEGVLQVRASHGIDTDRLRNFAEPLDELLLERLQEVFGTDADCFIAVPLVVGGEITGLLAATRSDSIDAQRAEWLLSALADQASMALDGARQLETRERMRRELGVLQASASEKEQALRILSHDLRSPLNTILSYAELLESGILGDINDRQRGALDRMRESGHHLLTLLQNMLDMTRLTAGGVAFELQAFDLADAVRSAGHIVLVPRASTHKMQVDAPAPVIVCADPVHVRQVLIHLLDNAVKYTPAGTAVRAVCSQDGSWGMLRLEDDGPGIDAADVGRIFEPFQRGHDPADQFPTGSGLGLAIARGLLVRMSGRIEVESSPGHGTAFTIWLPLASS